MNGPLVSAGREETLPELAGLFDGWARSAGAAPGDRLAVISADRRVLAAAAVGLRERGDDGSVVSADAASPEVRAALAEQGFSRLEIGTGGVLLDFERSPQPAAAIPGRITLFTSGTTGTPKAVTHTWESLRTLRSGTAAPEHRWLLTYLPGTYAWFQMLTLWMFLPGQTLVAPAGSAPEEIWDEGASAGFDAVSATPSFWRYLLAMKSENEIQQIPLAQITLGGEPVRQDLLDRLRNLFQAVRLTHIYASTEVGAAIVVHDGKEGFPENWLEDGRRGLRVVDGELQVRSSHAAAGVQEWHATGDRTEVRNGRVLITGRVAEDLLNVGGRKVSAAAVEEALLASPLVSWCRVRGARAPLVGTLVAADVVLAAEGRALPPEKAERELAAHCAGRRLPEWMIPRLWNLLDKIPLSTALKAGRANA